MGHAEVIVLSEVRASTQWQRLRDDLHTRFDQWLDRLEEQLPDPQASLAEVTEAIWKLRQDLTGGLSETIVEQAHVDERTRPYSWCPQCGRRLKARPWVPRTVETMVGLVQVKRPYFYCTSGCGGVYPLDEALDLAPGRKQLDQLGKALKQVKDAGLIPEDQVRLCVVCDGASWIWKHIQSLFPSARQVLDYYHCKEYLHKVAKVQYESAERALEWVEATLTRLYMGKVGWVLGGLKRMKALSQEAAKAISNCWDYLYAHRDRTHYRRFRRGGYPIGSGGIESSHKFICHARLKRSGAWWYELNSNQMLALRCAKYNGTFDRVFERYRRRRREA
jgi:uncharacterized protein UPF0236